MSRKTTKHNSTTIGRLLRKNLSKVQLTGFVLSNFIGLAIVIAGIQFYSDIRSIWESEDSFINQDYLIVNKRVKASNTFGASSTDFTPDEIADIESQNWVRNVGPFSSADYEVKAYLDQGSRSMYTEMFLEAIPDRFIDIEPGNWHFDSSSGMVPVIISKDYLTLYNFGFASSAGLPQVTEGMLSSVPLTLRLSGKNGEGSLTLDARIVGYSNRLNTILVPEDFMTWSNGRLSGSATPAPRRLIIDVKSPGDVAITKYLEDHGLERAGDDRGSHAAYFVKVVAGVVIGIGALITLLSFFILLLSVALLMQKNRSKLHLLIMLGYDLRAVGRPYQRVTLYVSLISYALAVVAMLIFRNIYITGISGLTEDKAGMAVSLLCGAALVALTLIVNFISIRRKVRSAFHA